jgi:putative transposase
MSGSNGYGGLFKYNYDYLDSTDDGFKLYEGVQNHIGYYNNKIHHTTLETPNDRYEKTLQIAA